MRRIRIIKRVSAGLLAFLMIITGTPWDGILDVFAVEQRQVDSLVIINSVRTANPREYEVNFEWMRPAMGQRVDNLDVGNAGEPIPLDYNLIQRNATKGGETTYNSGQMGLSNLQGNSFNYSLTARLDDGSLYAYKILPFHYHYSGNTVTPIYPSGRIGKEVIFLTDIKVSARGSGKTLTVTWSNPSFNGGNFFSGYRIYYARGGASVKFPDADEPSGSISVAVGNPNLKVNSDGTFSYSFTADVEAGYFYAVKVEPLINGTVVNGLLVNGDLARKATKITYNGVTYDFHVPLNAGEYRVNDVYIKLPLYWTETMKDKLLLYWDPVSMGTSGGAIQKLEIIYSPTEDFADKKTIGTLYYPAAATILQFMVERPPSKGYYYYIITYEIQDPDYPNDPEKKLIKTLESEIASYDRGAVPFTPNKPLIKDVSTIPAVLENTVLESLDITWEAFYRKPVTDEEEEAAKNDTLGKIIDRNAIYDIWVTDDLANLDNDNFPPTYSNIPAANLTERDYPFNAPLGTATVPSYTYNITKYGAVANGIYSEYNITDNKVYYFKVRITRTNSLAREQASAFYSKYVPLAGSISTTPPMISRPPLRIKKVNGIEQITTNSITITWDTKWTEAYNSADKSWYCEIGVAPNGSIVFGKDITEEMRNSSKVIALNNAVYLNHQKVSEDLLALGTTQDNIALLPLRIMDLSGTEPRIHVAKKSEVDFAGGYEAYVESLLLQDGDPTSTAALWTLIKPTGSDPANHPEYTITDSLVPPGKLEPNTQYVIIFRPFLTSGSDTLKAYYPSYVMGTTLIVTPPIEVMPTVPIIEGVSQTDISVTVRWEYKEDYGYELSYAELLSQYDSGGTVIGSADVARNGVKRTENNKTYIYYTVTGLFPMTTYYFWVRAEADNGVTILRSGWSNPIMMKTADILPPDPPQGLGLASEGSLDIINKQMNLDPPYVPVEYNYMVIEFLKNPHDFSLGEGAGGNANADAEAEILTSEDITATLITKFNGLIANKTYYIRAKTTLTITKGEEPKYSYTLQISMSPEFIDITEVILPDGENTNTNPGADGLTIRKDSAWCTVVHFVTSPFKGEYDGDKNNSMYPLPSKDFEIIYDEQTDTLTLRFRSNGTGADGSKDNAVDQRFISQLLADKTFNYILDVTSYNGKAVTNRVIQFPKSIIDAFDERKISLTVRSGDISVTFMPGFTKTSAVDSLPNKGVGSSVELSFLSGTQNPDLAKRGSYLTKPQRLTLSYITPTTQTPISYTASPISVSLKAQNRYAALDSNIGGYLYSGEGDWSRQNSVYDNVSGQVSFTTTRVASYSAISMTPPKQTSQDNESNQAMRAVSSLMNISDINYYFPDAQTSVNQMNKLIAAVAKGSKDVAINQPLTDSERTSLSKAGLLISGEKTVARGDALSAMVKLYELKTKAQIRNYPAIDETKLTDISTLSPDIQKNLLKAESIGMIGGGNTRSRPNDAITLTETLQLLDIIILDAGL